MTTNQDQPPAFAGFTRDTGGCSTSTEVTETAGGTHLLAGTPGPTGINPRGAA